MKPGELSVMTPGVMWMPMWLAESWAFQDTVSCWPRILNNMYIHKCVFV